MYKSFLEQIERLEKGSRQRKMSFNPETDVSSEERKDVEDWSTTQISSAKDTMPEMNPNARSRQLAKWASLTQTKKHPETGEMMYLMHRGMSGEEFNKLQDSGFNKDYLSGWTPDYDVAASFQDVNVGSDAELDEDDKEEFEQKGYADDWTGMRYYGEEKLPRKTLSAWIPESQIHHIPQSIGSKRDYDFDSFENPFKEEEEQGRKERFERTVVPKKSEKFDKKNKKDFLLENTDHHYYYSMQQAAEAESEAQGRTIEPEEFESSLSDEEREGYRQEALQYANEDYEDWKTGKFDSEYQEPDSPIAPSAYKDQKEVMVKPHRLMIESDEERNQRLAPKTPIQKINEKINAKGGLTDKLGVPKLAASEKQISHKEAKDMLKELVMRKCEEFQHVDPEILEKNVARAFKNGISLLGLITGAHYMSPPEPTQEQLNPPAQERSIASEQIEKPKIQSSSNTSFRANQIENFLKAISMNESSGGINTDHETMKHGIHAGDAAIGKYGLMPNTIKEMAGRMGKDSPYYRYSKMKNNEIVEKINKNPEHEEQIANYMANHLYDKHGGNETRMAYSWNQGHNLTDKHFDTSHKNYKDHDYTQKYIKHRQQLEKTPYVAESPEQ
jgi:hypothetical protein